jgi:peroxiredoxin
MVFLFAIVAGVAGCDRSDVAAAPVGSKDTGPGGSAGNVESTDSYKVLSLEDLDVLLKSQRGKTVVVNFWATWCPPCVEELPEFGEFYKAHKDDEGVTLLSISADHPETVDSILKPFVAKHMLPFPIYIMDFMPSEELTGILGYEWIDGNLPATFVIKPDGTLQNVWFVTVTKADLEKSVEKAKGTLKP